MKLFSFVCILTIVLGAYPLVTLKKRRDQKRMWKRLISTTDELAGSFTKLDIAAQKASEAIQEFGDVYQSPVKAPATE